LFDSGELKIAEVASRFTDAEEFASLINSIGFKFKSKVGCDAYVGSLHLPETPVGRKQLSFHSIRVQEIGKKDED
jgi:hypothetical protein